MFGVALVLAGTPWQVVGVRFDPELKRHGLDLEFPPVSSFHRPETDRPFAV